MKKIVTSTILAVSSIATAFAQTGYTPAVSQQGTVTTTAIQSLVTFIDGLVNALLPIVVAIAVLAFFWFLVRFIWKGGEDPEARKKSLGGMGWSIVALFVMVSIWGLIGFIGSVTGIGQGGKVPLPTIR